MFGILISAIDREKGDIGRAISQIKSQGYQDQDISIIAKLEGYKQRETDTILSSKKREERELNNLLARAQTFPSLGGLLISGPITSVINLFTFIEGKASLNQSENQSSLFKILLNFGIPSEDSLYFSEIVNRNGLIIILPDFGNLDIYEILWSCGADRIIILEENTPIIRKNL